MWSKPMCFYMYFEGHLFDHVFFNRYASCGHPGGTPGLPKCDRGRPNSSWASVRPKPSLPGTKVSVESFRGGRGPKQMTNSHMYMGQWTGTEKSKNSLLPHSFILSASPTVTFHLWNNPTIQPIHYSHPCTLITYPHKSPVITYFIYITNLWIRNHNW